MNTPGKKFRHAIADNNPLMVVGAVNAYCAKMAEKAGHKALYLSGAGVANASFGLPDLAITTLNDVAEDSRRITQATNLPLLIDIDTGFGGAFSILVFVFDSSTIVYNDTVDHSSDCTEHHGKNIESQGCIHFIICRENFTKRSI